MRALVAFVVIASVFAAVGAAEDADQQVRAMVKECRELLAADRLDEAVEKVKAALEVEGAGLRTQGTIYNVYSDVMRKRGDTVAADKSLLKAYDLLLKAKEEKVAKSVAVRLAATPDGKALLENYRTRKREKAELVRKDEAAARAAKRAEEAEQRKASFAAKRSGGSSSVAANGWNPWKKGVTPRKFDSKAKRDEALPWTPDDAAKLTGVPAGRGWNYIDQTYQKLAEKFGKQRALNWYEYVLSKPTKFDIPRDQMPTAWNYYGFRAFNALDHARVLQTLSGLKSCGGEPGGYFSYRAMPSVKLFEDIKTFPRDTATIKIPTENPWVKGTRKVYAKSFGWNAADATACIRKALDAPGDIVVLEKMEGPWRIGETIEVPGDKTIIFEKGVKVIGTEAAQRANSKACMFVIRKVDNVALIGKGEVQIGWYPDGETRDRYVHEEGGTGIYIDGGQHVLIRDLDVSECGCDGITLGGCHRMTADIWIENVKLDHNARQGMSLCNGADVYIHKVEFTNTRGAQPMAGIDFEPSIQEVQATSNVYIWDCKFAENRGNNIVFSESSTYPVTVLFKNCFVGEHHYGAISIGALCGLYQGNGTDAPSDIIFDGCRIEGASWCPPVSITGANLFHVTFRNCDVVEVKGKPVGRSPFQLLMNREYYNPKSGDRTWYQKEGSIAFDGTKVSGWKGADPLEFVDQTGHYSVERIFGKVTMNGKPCDMARYRYAAPDFQFEEAPLNLEATDLKANEQAASAKPGDVKFHWRAAWWVGDLAYELFSPDGRGGFSSQVFKEGGEHLAGKPGCAFRTKCSDGLIRVDAPTTLYFEVPAGKGEAVLKIVGVHHAEVLKGREKVLETVTSQTLRNGYAYIRLKQGQKPQIYGIRATSGTTVFKLFAPCSGIVAADPNSVPTVIQKGKEK